MAAVTLTDAERAVEDIRRAADVIGRVRDVQVQVRCVWQQIDDRPDESGAELKDLIAEVTKGWLASQSQAVRPHFDIGFTMMLPVIWQDGAP